MSGCFGLAQTWGVSVVSLRCPHYSPGAPKPMDVIRCPLTSMYSKSGDFTTHAPSHAFTWRRKQKHFKLTAAHIHPQITPRLTCFPLSNLLSAMFLKSVESKVAFLAAD